jgi:hypothetical protein
MIWFSEINGEDVIFYLIDREMPEHISFGKNTELNKIRYAGGHQTNQIIGTYNDDIEWSGVFYGTYNMNGKLVPAVVRSKEIEKLIGRPITVGFPSDGQWSGDQSKKYKVSEVNGGGEVGTYIIESFVRRVKNPLHIEYDIKLSFHERQKKIKPEETVNVQQKTDPQILHNTGKKAQTIAKKTNNPQITNKGKIAADNAVKVAQKTIPAQTRFARDIK